MPGLLSSCRSRIYVISFGGALLCIPTLADPCQSEPFARPQDEQGPEDSVWPWTAQQLRSAHPQDCTTVPDSFAAFCHEPCVPETLQIPQLELHVLQPLVNHRLRSCAMRMLPEQLCIIMAQLKRIGAPGVSWIKLWLAHL